MLDYRLEPDQPSQKEMWVENKVNEWFEKMDLTVDGESLEIALDLYIDFDKLEKELTARAEQMYEDMVADAKIEAYLEREEARMEDVW